MRTRQTQLLLRTKVLKLDVTITCKDVASSKSWWHAWAPSHFWMEPSPIEGDSLLTLIQTPFWDNLWQTKTSIHHTQGPPIRKPRTGWSLSQSNAEVLHRSEHGRANPEDARHIHKPFRIPDKKMCRKMWLRPRMSNGPCQEHNHKISEAILMVPCTSKCRSHIQTLEDGSHGRKTPWGLHSNLWLHWTTGTKSKPMIWPPA